MAIYSHHALKQENYCIFYGIFVSYTPGAGKLAPFWQGFHSLNPALPLGLLPVWKQALRPHAQKQRPGTIPRPLREKGRLSAGRGEQASGVHSPRPHHATEPGPAEKTARPAA